jgi:2-oxoisovalerate dehydrogenase E1 component
MAEPIDDNFTATLLARPEGTARAGAGDDHAPLIAGSSLTVDQALDIFDSQLGSRHLDLAARALRADHTGFYTIGSSGHESNAAIAHALRPTDPALLHYRSGAFFLQRARQGGGGGGRDPIRDVLLGVVAASEEPISGGRHKVFGRYDLHVIPQTSTIASHLPRAFGIAFMLDRAHKLAGSCPWPADAIVVTSFGDASADHSTAVGAVNAALNAAYRGIDTPLLLVCEDNGIGISTKTPTGWIASTYANRAGLTYFAADGSDLNDTYSAARAAADWVRDERRPAFLHLRTVRLMGHAGSDYESAYRTPRDITADYARDPVLTTAQVLVEQGHRTVAEVIGLYEQKRATVMKLAKEVAQLPQLDSAAAVTAPLVAGLHAAREASRPVHIAPSDGGRTLAQAINFALHDIFEEYRQVIMFGEDVARKGGVYGVTRGLHKKFGARRVFDTILDEQTILGIALGAGLSGLLPIPEIQYLAYIHNALDQIRGEGATLQFFSNRQYLNPAVVRVAGYGYQKGFGGHFHNDNSVAALLDIPGVIVASPSHPDDAAAMLRACATAAVEAGALCVFLEPIALYHTRDLYAEGDGGWLSRRDSNIDPTIGTARTHGDGADLTILTFGNGVPMSLRVAQRLRQEHAIHARVTDLRWLAPLPVTDLLRDAHATGRVLVVDETRRSGGVAEHVIAALVDHEYAGRIARVASEDSFIPLGDAALHVLLDERTIENAAVSLCRPRTGVEPRERR